MLTVACVRTGSKYGPEYVQRLRSGVARHLSRPHRFVCLTDRPLDEVGCETIPTVYPTWFAKLELFKAAWRDGPLLYFDLDTVITGNLDPLADIDCEFGICENFTRLAGNLAWPCRYGSCVMKIASGYGEHIWRAFQRNADAHMGRLASLGDQRFIEELEPNATLLQRVLPPGFFLGYRDLPSHPVAPAGCSVVIFAGAQKPHNTACEWAKREWLWAA